MSRTERLAGGSAVLMVACWVLLPVVGGALGGGLIASGSTWVAVAGVAIVSIAVALVLRRRRRC